MIKRNPIVVFLLTIVTFGLYSWYWLVKTKGELNAANNNDPRIPTAWIWLIPVVGTLWWLWKFSEGVGKYTNDKLSNIMAFVVLFLLPFGIGQAVVQDALNKVESAPAQPTQ